MNTSIKFLLRTESRNAVFYGIFALLWVFISDELLFVLTKNNQNSFDWHSLKDVVFVIVSSVFVYNFFLRERQTRDRAFDQELEFVHEIGRFAAGSIEYATFSLDAGGLVKTWDSAAARMLGRSSDEVLGHHFLNCFVGQEFWKPKDLLRQASDSGRASFTGWLNHYDGTRYWGEVAFEKINLLKGQFAYGVMIRNLSGARGSERFTSMIESMNEGLIVIDRDWRFAFLNTVAGELLDREPAKLIGKTLWSEFPLEEFTELGLNCKKAMDENLSSVITGISPRSGRWMENRIYPSPDGILIFYADVTEKNHIQEAIRINEQRLRLVLEAGQQSFFDLDLQTGMTTSDSEVLDASGARQAVVQEFSEWIDQIHPHDQERTRDVYESFIAQQSSECRVEFRVRLPDGSWRWKLSQGVILERDEINRPVRMMGTLIDIQIIKDSEQALQTSNQRYFRLMEASPIALFESNADGETVYVNEKWRDIMGFERILALDYGWTAMLHPSDKTRVMQAWTIAIADQTSFALEYRIVQQNGNIRWVYVLAEPLKNAEQRVTGYLGSIVDLTMQKQAELELEGTKKRLQAIVKASPTPIVVLDSDGLVEEWNTASETLFGWRRNEVLGQLSPLFNHEDPQKLLDRIAQTSGGNKLNGVEIRPRHKDGTLVDTLLYTENLPVTELNPQSSYIGVYIDMTERRRASQALEQNREDLNQAQRVANVGSYSRDIPDGTFELSEQGYRIFGIPLGEAITFDRMMQSIHPQDRPIAIDMRDKFLKDHQPTEFEYRVVHPDESIRFVLHKMLMNNQNDRTRVVGTLLDITERKLASQELEQNRNDLNQAQRVANVGSYSRDIPEGWFELSEQGYRIFGIPLTETITFDRMVQSIHPEDRPNALDMRDKFLKNQLPTEFEYRVVHPDGSIRFVLHKVLMNIQDDRTRVVGTLLDVTERKLASQELEKSEKLYRTITENAHDVTVVSGVDGKIHYLSPSVMRVFGNNLENAQQRMSIDFVHPDDVPAVITARQQAIDSRKDYYSILFRAQHANGNYVWVESDSKLTRDPKTDQVIEIQSTVRDVHNRVLAQEQLKSSEELYRTITENAYDVTIISNIDGTIRYCSPSFKNIFGYTDDQTGRKIFDFFHPDDINPYFGVRNNAIDKQQSLYTQSFQFQHQDGHYIWVESVSKIIRDAQNSTVEIQSTLRDISERRQVQAELEQLNALLEKRVDERTKRLNEVNKELESFTSSVSHDLRSPLNVVQGFGRALLEDFGTSIPEEGLDYVQRMVRAAVRMDTLITDLLQYSRLSKSEIKLTPTPLEPLLVEVRSELQNEIAKQGANVVFIGEFPSVQARELILRQALINLVGNGLKFMTEGKQPEIKIWAETDHDQMVRIHVQDNGIGIASEHLEKIFLPFERLHGTSEYPGSGIGLAFVKRAIDRMGGQVGVISTPKQGSHFWLELAGTRELS